MSFNKQHQSAFFTTPTEIRHAIYANIVPDQIHVSCRETDDRISGRGLRFSPCVQLEKDGDADCIKQRASKADWNADMNSWSPTFLRRLQSSWGPHWRCEETLFHANDNCTIKNALAPLFVCKRM